MSDSCGLRVAQLANYVGPGSGGLRVVVDELGRAHREAGRARLLVLPTGSDTSTGPPQDRRVGVTGPPLPLSRKRYRVLLRRRPVLAALEAFGPDVVEVHDQTTLAWVGDWARTRGVRSVLFCHERLDLVLAEASGLPASLWARAGRDWSARLAASFDTVVCASAFAARPFLPPGATDPRTGPVNLHVVPFGVDLAAFTPDAVEPAVLPLPTVPRQGDPADRTADGRFPAATRPGSTVPGFGRPWRLVFAGRLFPEKAPQVALEVLARLLARGHPAELLVAGSGPLDQALRRDARRDRLPVRFLGRVADRSRLAALLAGADVVVSPGPRETFGLTVLESLACGTPVVVSRHGAARELVTPGTGGWGEDAAELATEVERLLTDPDRHAAARTAARRRAEQFPWSATVSALDALTRGALPTVVGPAGDGG